MLVTDSVLGNVDDDADLRAAVETRPADEVERVVLDERERRRSRIRTATDAGTEIGVVVEDERGLEPGDVLVNDDERVVLVEFADREALVVAFTDGDAAAMARAAELGHAVGNRHRDLAVRDGEVLIALDTDGDRTVETVEAMVPPDTEMWRERVDPTLFDDAGTADHDHRHGGGGHAHDHGDDHTHSHDDTGHSHGQGSHGHAPGTGVRTLDEPSAGEEGDG
ncbi:urease accessory protein UreE [Halorientalis pallida]|uniref:Urease accessory protein UreE n=1 Tax=Halorientalis pallida TaxID=2479928 RepID=A0A498KZW9_9EURY|nr:urease accessory protein UreE [Halorientalis pallida]RXK51568.1 urease accessory protein UreE [Halorientalis pallida]